MADLGVEVGALKQKVADLSRKKTKTTKKGSKKKPGKKRQTVKKWKLERVAAPDRVLYQKKPKKGYLLIVPKNSIVRDTTDNRTKYANVPYIVSTTTAAAPTAMQVV